MSVKDSHIGRGSVKRMLRRNLLGKSGIQTGSRRFPVCSNCSCTLMEISTGGCEGNTGEEGGTREPATEPQRPSEENRDLGSFAEPVRGAESTEVDRSDRNRFARKLRAFTQIFSTTSVSCLACAQRPDERDDGGEHCTVTVFNRETRDSLELTAQSAAACRVSEHDFVLEKEESNDKRFKLLTRLIALPKLQSKAKSPGRVSRLRRGRLMPGSLTKGRRPPKPSPFYQERIGETQEFVEEEVIVLADERADGAPSVHACAVTLEMKDGDGSPEAPPRVSDGSRVTAGPREGQVTPRVLEDRSARNGPSSQDVGEWQNMEHPRLRATYESNTIHHKASVEHVNKTPAGTVRDNLNADMFDDDDVQSRRVGRRTARSCNGENAELLEVASSVVRVAIKAAVSQFKLLDTMSSLDQEDWMWNLNVKEN